MVCPEYDILTPVEKTILIGEIVHCIQSDSKCYELAKGIISLAIMRGIFDGIKILPETENQEP